MSEHRAFCEPDGDAWLGGCHRCGTSFIETDQGRAQAWVSGHDSAVACQRSVATSMPPIFAPTGPGEAITVGDLRELADTADSWFGGEAEIVFPADQPPWLYVFTRPTEEGWRREFLGGLCLQYGGDILQAPNPGLPAMGESS